MEPVQFYKCLSDETRLRCLLLIQKEGELCVCELMEALDDIQPKVSRHLAQLRTCGILDSERRGQWMFYKLNPALPVWALTALKETQKGNPAFLKDNLKRLQRLGIRANKRPSCT